MQNQNKESKILKAIDQRRRHLDKDLAENKRQLEEDIKEMKEMKEREGKAVRFVVAHFLPKLSEHRTRLMGLKNHTTLIKAMIKSGQSGAINIEDLDEEKEEIEEGPEIAG